MKPKGDCGICLLKWVYERASLGLEENLRFKLTRDLSKVLEHKFHPTANLGSLCNELLSAIRTYVTHGIEHYKKLKKQINETAAKILPLANEFINNADSTEERFKRACFLASVSNVAPLGRPIGGFNFEEVRNIIEEKAPIPIVVGDLYKTFQAATHVLYITDNAGEVGFDSLLIREIKTIGPKVTLVVKDEFFEDATIEDAEFFSLNEIIDDLVIVDGIFVPGKTSVPADKAFWESDLIVAKGTGNFEALAGESKGKRVVYMLKVKCDPVAANIGVEKGNFVIKVE